MAVDLSNWTPIYRINLPDDAPGKVVTAEYWTTLWRASVTQGDHAEETLEALLEQLDTTVWHPTDAAETISSPAIYAEGGTNVAAQLSELFNDLDLAKGDISELTTQVALRRLSSEPLTHNDPDDIIGRDAADAHPISAITGLQTVLDDITAGEISAFSHNDISNRDAVDAHPVSAITGLATWQTDIEDELDEYAGMISTAQTAILNLDSKVHNTIGGRDIAGAHPVSAIAYDATTTLLQKLNNLDGIISNITGDVSTLTHNDLAGLTAADAHPVASITGLQTALNAKQATITGGASTIASSNLTANRALISDGSGKVAVSAVTSTELSHLDGVTSSVQTQINSANTAINTKQKQITAGTANPSGGSNGDVYIKYA